MDPNATLQAIRDALNEAENATEHTDEREDALQVAGDRFRDLDEWLGINGGMLPDDWKLI